MPSHAESCMGVDSFEVIGVLYLTVAELPICAILRKHGELQRLAHSPLFNHIELFREEIDSYFLRDWFRTVCSAFRSIVNKVLVIVPSYIILIVFSLHHFYFNIKINNVITLL
jgi:hypothetical protein